MNRALADNIRTLRAQRAWTQEQLADAAQLHHRTIQRAEAADGASAETLLAIAGALDVDADLLRFDGIAFLAHEWGVPREAITPELIKEKKGQLVDPHYVTVTMARVTASADLQPVVEAMGMYFKCTTRRDDIQDVAALLQNELDDLVTVSDLDATTRRQCEVNAFQYVKRLETLGAAVTIGWRQHSVVLANMERLPWSTAFVIVAPVWEAKEFILVPRSGCGSPESRR
jgi:transcriptional regulator with XRE-family HTH domain